MLNTNTHVKQRGIGLLELMLSLAIIAILIVMATRYFSIANTSQQVNRAAQQIGAITSAVQSYKSGGTQLPGTASALLADMYSEGLLSNADYNPQSGLIVDPWGNSVGVAITGPGTATLTYSGMPSAVCANLAAKLGSATTSENTSNLNPFVTNNCSAGSPTIIVTLQ